MSGLHSDPVTADPTTKKTRIHRWSPPPDPAANEQPGYEQHSRWSDPPPGRGPGCAAAYPRTAKGSKALGLASAHARPAGHRFAPDRLNSELPAHPVVLP